MSPRQRQFRPDRKKQQAAAQPKPKPQPEQKGRAVIFSYWPLLRSLDSFGLDPASFTDLENDMDTVKAIMDHLDEHYTAGTVEGILWTQRDGTSHPVFVLEQAKEVAEHISEWAEGNPGEWFKLRLISRQLDDNMVQYALVLMPDLEKGIKRMKANTGVEEEMAYTIVFRPVTFTGRGPTFGMIEPMIPDRVKLEFIDSTDVDLDNPDLFENLEDDAVIEVGEFELERCNEEDHPDMVDVLEDQEKPLHEGWVNPNFKA